MANTNKRTTLRMESLEGRDVPTTAGWTVGAPPATMNFVGWNPATLDQQTADAVWLGGVRDDVVGAASFTAATTGTYRIHTSAGPSGNIDTVLGVYDRSGRRIAANDDVSTTNRFSAVDVNLRAGVTYQVAVGRYTRSPDGVTRQCYVSINGPNDDRWEKVGSNDTPAGSNLGTIQGTWNSGPMTMRDQYDFFRFTLPRAGGPDDYIWANFRHAQGDIDMVLRQSGGTATRSATGITDNERISLNGLPAGIYYLQVYGYTGATNPGYALTIHQAVPQATDLGQRVANWAAARDGQRVGTRGECTDLVDGALRANGAQSLTDTGGPVGTVGDYVWSTNRVLTYRAGDPASALNVLRPGDVIQYRDFRNADGFWATQHTAIVQRVNGNGTLTILEQNWQGGADAGRVVRSVTMNFANMTAGTLWFYRPVAR